MHITTIEQIKEIGYGKLEPVKVTIPKGECIIGKFIILTDETYTKDQKTTKFKRLFITDFEDPSKIYYINLFGFHDRFITGIKLLVRGSLISVACTAIKDDKWPSYAIGLIDGLKLANINWKQNITVADSSDDIPF